VSPRDPRPDTLDPDDTPPRQSARTDMPAGISELERVVLAEVRRIGRAVDALAERVESKLDVLARDAKAESEKLEARVRALELESAKAGTRIGMWGALAGIAAAGAAEAIFAALIHH